MNDKKIIIAKDKAHLKELITDEIKNNSIKCDLNHIDVSQVFDMSYLFWESDFNGDISKWDVSNAVNTQYMFHKSKFNGDISHWNTSNVITMYYMFSFSKFNGDISDWDTSNVVDIRGLFFNSTFYGDTSNWNTNNVTKISQTFLGCPAPIPWWHIEDEELRKQAIVKFNLMKKITNDLSRTPTVKEKPYKI